MEPYQELEKEWAAFLGLDPSKCVACASGTAALHLALEVTGVRGRSVIVPDYTMVACARAVSLAGGEPEFVGPTSATDLNMDAGMAAQAVNLNLHRYAAVMAVHVYGRVSDLSAVPAGVPVVEDMAELHGVKPHPWGYAACWSFYKNKVVHGEEGGMVYFRWSNLADHARMLRSLGFTPAHDYRHVPRGHNYRMSNTHATLIRSSLAGYDEAMKKRRRIEDVYDALCPPEWRLPARRSPWVYDIRVPRLSRHGRAKVVRGLNDRGAAVRCGFEPMSAQEEYQACMNHGGAVIESAEYLYLPIQPDFGGTERLAKLVFDTLRKEVQD